MMHMMRLLLRSCSLVLLSVFLIACEIQLYGNLAEHEANEMVSVLLMHGVNAKKTPGKKGMVNLMVPEEQFSKAIEILKAKGFPKTQFSSLCTVFTKEGMISSPLEEKARYICAKSQEISQTLSDIDGVITARVHVVLPESDKLGDQTQEASASVYIKHRHNTVMTDYIPQIKHLVQNSIESLDYEKITVALFPADDSLQSFSTAFQQTSTVADNDATISKSVLFVLIIILVAVITLALYLFFAWYKMSRSVKANRSSSRGGGRTGSGGLQRV